MNTKPFILVCDDNEPIAKALEVLLNRAGFRTQAVNSALHCVAVARQTPPDLILMDVMMPGMDGATVSDLLKEVPGVEQVPIILLSALPEDQLKRRAMEVDAAEYVLKPFRMYQLIEVIQRTLAAAAPGMFPEGKVPAVADGLLR